MMDFPNLIQLFATHPVARIATVPEYTELCRKHVENVQFRRQRDTVEVAKKAIEELLDGKPTCAAQVREALIKLQGLRGTDFDLYYDLIVAGYKPRWSPQQQTYFERIVPSIRTGQDFFLSFTTRGPTVGFKRINQRYWYFIRNVIGEPNIPTADRRTKNLLAEALYAKLLDASLRGFYYVVHENDNAIVEDKLTNGLRGSRVFVQLVENVMFEPPTGRPNYCDYEYRRAIEFISEEDRILFVVTEESPDDLVAAEGVYEPYRDWVQRIRAKALPYLPSTQEYNGQRLKQIQQKVADIVWLVKSARKSVLDRIPA
ncbi:MAG TPA: hypothetical protein VNZ03_37285 [Terriglobales bacterium]|jgi:hypothetical protein|nr:hypothetical protein [Terriglobales bacterium]